MVAWDRLVTPTRGPCGLSGHPSWLTWTATAADLAGVAVGQRAFLDLLSGHAEDPRVAAMSERATAVFAGKLPEAQRAGRYAEDVAPADLLMAVGMVSGLVARSPAAERRAAAERSWALLRAGIQGEASRAAGRPANCSLNFQLTSLRPEARD